MEENMVSEGFKFMALGMGTVFIFLVLMVIVINIQAKLINKYFPEKPEQKRSPSKKKQSTDDEIVAAITAAITKFRN